MTRERALGQPLSELDQLVEETQRALAFGRSHVVIVSEGSCARALPSRLAEAVRDEIRVVTLRFEDTEHATVTTEEATARATEALRAATAEPLPGDALDSDPPQRARLVLLVPDALALSPEALRALHWTVTRSGDTHRLVVLVDREASELADPASEVAARLGEGLSKVERERPARFDPEAVANAASAVPSLPQPPVVEAGRTRKVRPISVRHVGRPPRATRILRVGALVAVAAAAVFAGPKLIRTLETRASGAIDPAPPSTPVAESGVVVIRTGTAPQALPPEERAEEGADTPDRPIQVDTDPLSDAAEDDSSDPPSDPAPPVAAAAVSPPAAPDSPAVPDPPAAPDSPTAPDSTEAAAPPEDEPEPAAPITVGVNFNADPWAELVVDGRAVGPTPVSGIQLAPGEHRVQATFPDGRVVERRVRVDALRNRFRIE